MTTTEDEEVVTPDRPKQEMSDNDFPQSGKTGSAISRLLPPYCCNYGAGTGQARFQGKIARNEYLTLILLLTS